MIPPRSASVGGQHVIFHPKITNLKDFTNDIFGRFMSLCIGDKKDICETVIGDCMEKLKKIENHIDIYCKRREKIRNVSDLITEEISKFSFAAGFCEKFAFQLSARQMLNDMLHQWSQSREDCKKAFREFKRLENLVEHVNGSIEEIINEINDVITEMEKSGFEKLKNMFPHKTKDIFEAVESMKFVPFCLRNGFSNDFDVQKDLPNYKLMREDDIAFQHTFKLLQKYTFDHNPQTLNQPTVPRMTKAIMPEYKSYKEDLKPWQISLNDDQERKNLFI